MNYFVFPEIHYTNLNYEQDLIGKNFHKKNYTEHIYYDYLKP